MKTLKQFFEIYKPKAKDEQDFVDKHVVIKHKDHNGNGDDVFNGKVKPVDRKKTRLGYDPGDDEKVYEEVQDLDELKYDTLFNYRVKAKKAIRNPDTDDKTLDKRETGWNRAGRRMNAQIAKEEVEDLDELSKKTLGSYINKAATDMYYKGQDTQYHANKAAKADGTFSKASKEKHRGLERKANLKASNRSTGIERATKNLTREEVEDLDELSRGTLASYVKKAGGRGLDSAGAHGMDYGVKLARNDFSKSSRDKSLKKAVNRATGVERAADRLAKEEVELGEGKFVVVDRNKKILHMTNTHAAASKKAEAKGLSVDDHVMSHAFWQDKHGPKNEEVEIDETVKVSHDRYLRSHGKKASGSGGWIFTHKKSGNIDLGDDKSSHIGKGKFSDAAKSAKEWAKKHGHTTIYVAEDFNEDVVRNAILEMAEIEGLDLTEEELEDLVVSMIEEVEDLDEARERTSNYLGTISRDDPEYDKKLSDLKKNANGATTVRGRLGVNNPNAPLYRKGGEHHKRSGQQVKLKHSTRVDVYSRKGKAKTTNEEVEELDELSKGTLGNYVKKASNRAVYHTAQQMTTKDVGNMEYHGKKVVNRLKGLNKAATKLTKEDVINRAIEKYASIDESNLPTRAERLVSKLDGMSESHIHALLGLFDSLNEDNQMKMLATADTHEGVLSLLDFAIANRGE